MKRNLIKTLIIDDEPLAREYIKNLLTKHENIQIAGEAGNGRDALRLIRECEPDLIFLDVQMPEANGFAVLKSLTSGKLPAIVFTTAYEEYAISAFEVHALDYLLKPFDSERFAQAVNHAREQLLLNRQLKKPTEPQAQIKSSLETLMRVPAILNACWSGQRARSCFLKRKILIG